MKGVKSKGSQEVEMFRKFLHPSVIGIAFLLAACASVSTPVVTPAPVLSTTPMPTPTPDSIGVEERGILHTAISCRVTFRATYADHVLVEKPTIVRFDSGGLFVFKPPSEAWYDAWNAQLSRFEEEILETADKRLWKALGVSDDVWSNSIKAAERWRHNGDNMHMFAFTAKGVKEAPAYYGTSVCPNNWIVEYQLRLDEIQPGASGPTWTLKITKPNATSTAYLTLSSQDGMVEFPLREMELRAIMSEEYNPQNAIKEVVFLDPTDRIGAAEYEKKVIEYATQIRNEGELVGRFNWTSIESQEIVNDLLSRVLLLKAWRSNSKVHQAAWFAFLKEKTVASTSITVSSSPVSGTFFLGIGSLRGGASSTTFNQTLMSAPAIYGDLYVK